MDISERYKLGDGSYHNKSYDKTLIVLGDTLDKGMNHFNKWGRKINGNYKKTATYTVSLDGLVYEHFNPKYFSNFLGNDEIDKHSISIVLENEGWLIKDFKLNEFINWSGDIYNREGVVVKKNWRNKSNWSPYSDKQLDSLVLLCKNLTQVFNISKTVSPDNLIIEDFGKESGIYYKSNYNKKCTEVSPAFNFKEFKEKIENGKY